MQHPRLESRRPGRAWPGLLAPVLLVLGCMPSDDAFERGYDEFSSGGHRFIVGLRRSSDASSVLTDGVRTLADDYALEVVAVSRIAGAVVVEGSDDEIEALGVDSRVAYVERDRIVELAEPDEPAPWNLDRLDESGVELDGRYDIAADGAGVTIYVVDTGVRTTHAEFEGRIASGFSTVDDDLGVEDCHGHGTKVAALAGGTTWGVAKAVDIVPVRVFDCHADGSVSGIIAGLDFIARDARGPAVANLSFRTGPSRALDDAVRRLIDAGVVVVAAAGNDDDDACGFSPARVRGALTVGATDAEDVRTDFSSHGPCVDLFAPGIDLLTAGRADDQAWTTGLGTSMAAPHVAGAAALQLAEQPDASPAVVHDRIAEVWSLHDAVGDAGARTPNRLLNVRYANMGELVARP